MWYIIRTPLKILYVLALLFYLTVIAIFCLILFFKLTDRYLDYAADMILDQNYYIPFDRWPFSTTDKKYSSVFYWAIGLEQKD